MTIRERNPEPESERVWRLLLVLIAGYILAFLLLGCVNTRLTDSYDQTIDTVAEEWILYVRNDASLTDSQKRVRELHYATLKGMQEDFKKGK